MAGLQEEWERLEIPIDLKVLHSPYREITKPVLDYVSRLRSTNPRDIVTVYIPEYVVGHWWEQLLHNQSALRLKGRLLYQRGVVVASVPYQLQSSQRLVNQPLSPRMPGLRWSEPAPSGARRSESNGGSNDEAEPGGGRAAARVGDADR